jgi:UDP-N-acetyl-D-galactosamine dehydrogenase
MKINSFEEKIAVIGLGYVGLPLAVEFGKNRAVIGFDINQDRIAELNAGKDTTLEITSDNLLAAKNLKFTDDLNSIKDCKIYIITVPTPIDKANRPDLMPLINATRMVAEIMLSNSIIIYESTVYPGCTEEICVPVIEKYSGLLYNRDFYCGYSPERVVPGDKIHTLANIKKITSGSTPEAASFVDNLYSTIVKVGTWRASCIKVAEAAKVIENSQRDLNIAFVNELSMIFDRLGIDTIEVLEAAGSKWNFLPFRPGLVGGHCIGVDPYYLTHKAEEVGYNPQVILGGRRINDGMAKYVADSIVKRMLANGVNIIGATVGVLGITFKDNCPDIRNSKVFDLIQELQSWGLRVVVSDPWADTSEVKREYGIDLDFINEYNIVDSLVVAVAHNEFRSLDLETMRRYCKPELPILADIKAIFKKQEVINAGFTLFRL